MPHRPANPIIVDHDSTDDPITFGIGTEVFQAVPQPTADAIRIIIDPDFRTGGLAYRFIEAVLTDATDVERFREACADRTHITLEKEIADTYLWLVEVYGQRPTAPSSGSSLGPAPTQTGSTDGSSSPTSPLPPSLSTVA